MVIIFVVVVVVGSSGGSVGGTTKSMAHLICNGLLALSTDWNHILIIYI